MIVSNRPARALLLQRKAPLIDVAMKVGGDSAKQFAKACKKTSGQTPTQLRKAKAH